MFGLLKKKVSAAEFGQGILHLSHEFIASDAGRALGTRFENFDASNGWANFLERRGVPLPVQKLHFRLYAHCAMQAASTQFEERIGREVTSGAMSGFTSSIEGYDFELTYQSLAKAYRGQYRFDPNVDALSNSEAQITFLPNSNVGVLNAKFLIENFVLCKMSNGSAFIDDFNGYSSTACATIGTVQRAIDQLSRSFKMF